MTEGILSCGKLSGFADAFSSRDSLRELVREAFEPLLEGFFRVSILAFEGPFDEDFSSYSHSSPRTVHRVHGWPPEHFRGRQC